MAALVKKAGVELKTGATQSPVNGTYTQTATKSAAGDLVIYRNESGEDISAYVTDPHDEMTFEAIMASSAEDKNIGDTVSVGGKTYLVTQWQTTESNEDVKRVSIGLRSTTITGGSAS